jgi:heat shock protein HslJ
MFGFLHDAPGMRTFFASALLLLAACMPAATTGGGGAIALAGTRWRLVEIGGQPPVAGADVTLHFEDGEAEGFGSCNQYRAEYTTSGTTLSFGPAMSTKRACVEPARNTQETAYLGALGKVASYTATDDRLTLLSASGAPLLTFGRAPNTHSERMGIAACYMS